MKNKNTIFYIIGAVILVAFLISSQVPNEEMISLTPHYYREGVEVFPEKGFFSIITPPGGSYDQISFDITVTNNGDIPFTDLRANYIGIRDGNHNWIKYIYLNEQGDGNYPGVLIGDGNLLISGEMSVMSKLINVSEFESLSQPTKFGVGVSAINTYTNINWGVDSQEWLSLTIEEEPWIYTGESYALDSENTGSNDIFWDGNNWWTLDAKVDSVFKYDSNWQYTGTKYYIGDIEVCGEGFYFDGIYWWVVGCGDYAPYVPGSPDEDTTISKFDSNWNHLTSFYAGNGETGPRDIFFDGTNWWITGGSDYVYKHEEDFSYTEIKYLIGTETMIPRGIFFEGNYWWVVMGLNIDKYDSNWNYLESYPIPFELDFIMIEDLFYDGDSWWVLGGYTDTISKFTG